MLRTVKCISIYVIILQYENTDMNPSVYNKKKAVKPTMMGRFMGLIHGIVE
jgi:hypothetical protein